MNPLIEPPKTKYNFLSLGAGVQSSTIALMAAHGEITPMPDAAIFADTKAEPASVYKWLDWLQVKLPFPVYRVSRGDMTKDSLNIIERKDKNGFYRISDQIRTTYFKVDGFPNDAKGYQVSLHIKNLQDEPQFKRDMMAFIERVCKTFNFEYDTYFNEYSGSKNYVIAFYNNLSN